ncbi:MAG: PilZ domain-containing protein [Methylococcaceae bacterium]
MMTIERRNESRTDAKGLKAKISVYEPNGSILVADVNLLDVSHSGIKLRVKKSLVADAGTKVQLEIILPESGIPIIVNAAVVHNEFESELGVHYIDLRPEDPIDQLINECKNWL